MGDNKVLFRWGTKVHKISILVSDVFEGTFL
mgnify:FL=1